MSTKAKTVLIRGLRIVAFTVVGAVIGYLSGPEVSDLVPAGYQFLITGAVIPALAALDKYLRYGNDPGEPEPPA